MKLYRAQTTHWNIHRTVFLFAGVFILLALAVYLSTDALLALAFVGLVGVMQVIFALTGYCPLAIALKHCGISEA
jgi:uncharacterized membrane protein YraQ (UPF0718 family)